MVVHCKSMIICTYVHVNAHTYIHCTTVLLQFLDEEYTWFALAELEFSYIVLMDLTLAHCIHTFEGCGRGHDLKNFSQALRARLLLTIAPLSSMYYFAFIVDMVTIHCHFG